MILPYSNHVENREEEIKKIMPTKKEKEREQQIKMTMLKMVTVWLGTDLENLAKRGC